MRLNNAVGLLNPNAPAGTVAPDTYVFLVFDRDSAAANATERKALRLAIQSLRANGLLISAAAARQGMGLTKNVFYYSPTGALTGGERAKIASCLR